MESVNGATGCLHSITRKINPFQKVRDLVSTDAKGDLKHLRIRYFLTHGRVKTRAALLNVSKVEARCIRDRLNMVVTGKIGVGSPVEIGIGSGNGRDILKSDRLRKGGAEVWIGCTAVADEPAGVDVEMHQVREALDA